MKKQTRLGLVTVFIVVIAIGLAVGFSGDWSGEDAIKIGASFPLSGYMAIYGEAELNGALLAAEEINGAGGINGKEIEIIAEDNRFDAKEAISAVNKLIEADDVDAIITGWTLTTMPIIPLIDEKNIPTFTWIGSDVGNYSNYLFNDKMDFAESSKRLTEAACEDDVKNIYYISILWEGEEDVYNAIEEAVNECGGNIVLSERFNYGESDFRTILLKVKSLEDVDAIAFFSYSTDHPGFLKQLTELGMDNIRLLDISAGTPEPWVTGGNEETLLEMDTLSIWYPIDSENPKTAEFIRSYETKYGEEPRPEASYTYDNVYMLKEAFERCDEKGGFTPKCVTEQLLGMNKFTGAAGEAIMDEDGDTKRNTALLKYTENGWEFIK